jgi:hypothetical protein
MIEGTSVGPGVVPVERRPGKLDWVIALGAVAVLMVSVVFTADQPPGFSICAFYSVTGLPCPGCGLTRAFCAISHGHWGDAWAFNPFGFLWYALTVFLVVRPLLIRLSKYAEQEGRILASRWSYIVPVVLVSAMWAYGLYRIWSAARHRPASTMVTSPETTAPSPSDPPASPAPVPGGATSPSRDSRV